MVYKFLILEKEITIDKDEVEQEIEFNFDVEKLKDEKEIELEVFGKLLYDECVLSVKHIPLLVRLGGRTLWKNLLQYLLLYYVRFLFLQRTFVK